jgi:hypothetical protein
VYDINTGQRLDRQRMMMPAVPENPGATPPPGWTATPDPVAQPVGPPRPQADNSDFKHPDAWDPSRPVAPQPDDLDYDPNKKPLGHNLAAPPGATPEEAVNLWRMGGQGQASLVQPGSPVSR